MNSLIQLKKATPVFFAALVCFGLLPSMHAVSPPPDGGYAGGNTAEGDNALLSLTSGGFNTAVGWFSLSSATTGSFNTGVGAGALDLNTGNENTATGTGALLLNTTGAGNTANGAFALIFNTGGINNTAVGDRALQNNTAGGNTAVGAGALENNTTASANTAIGDAALLTNTTGDVNTANGFAALTFNSTGHDNTALGALALQHNTTGSLNTALGDGALLDNTTGSRNIAIGSSAGFFITTTSNNIDIGNEGVAGDSFTIRVGETQTKTFIAGIRGVTTGIADAIPVLIDSNNQLGTMSSSRRFKKEISPMDKASEAILALRPVTSHYKSDKTDTPQFGLVAEEVAKVNPNLIVRDKDGEIYTVRYDVVNAMLLNEFLKEHRKVEQLTRNFESKLADQERQIQQLTVDLQKVSAQVEMNRTASQMMVNNE